MAYIDHSLFSDFNGTVKAGTHMLNTSNMKEFPYTNYQHISQNSTGSGNNGYLNTHRYTRNDIRVAENNLHPRNPFTNSKVMLSTNIFIYSNGCIVGMLQNFSVSEQRQINKLQAIGWEGVVQAVPNNTRGGTLNVSRIALYDSTLFSALGLTTYGVPHNTLGSKIHMPISSTATDTQSNANVSTVIKQKAAANRWDTKAFETSTLGKTVSEGLVFRTLKDQRAPLEISVKTRMRGNTNKDNSFYTVTYIDCWLSSYSKPYSVQNISISESATLQYADVY